MRPALVALSLAAATAHAGWRNTTVAGTPRDVSTPDAGAAVVAFSGGPGVVLYLAAPDAGPTAAQTMPGANYLSAALRGPCLMGFTGTAMNLDGPCLAGYVFHPQGGKVRITSSGVAYAFTASAVGLVAFERLAPSPAVTNATTWTQLSTGGAFGSPGFAMSTLATDAGEWAIADLYVGVTSTLSLFNNSIASGTQTVGPVRDLALFDHADRPGLFVATDGGQLLYTDDFTVIPLAPLTVPAVAWSTVTFTEKGGSPFGRGYGMATAGGQVYSPVPNPAQVGRQWVLRTGAPSGLTRVSCADPTFCAGVAGLGGPNVFTFFNEAPPTADLKPVNVGAGLTTLYTLDAGDPDGDPIWVTWIDGGFIAADGGNPFTIGVVGPPGSCLGAPTAPPLLAVLSDGLQGHDRLVQIPVNVTAGAANTPALIATPPALVQTAGTGPTETISAGFPADSGCTAPVLTWSIAPAGGPTLSMATSTSVQVTPPAVFCNATPQVFTVTASGPPDASVAVPVTLNPWGAPNPPVFATGVTQAAGTTQLHQPLATSTHACAATAGFPGTELVWLGIDAGTSAGVTAVPSAGGLTVTSTDSCVPGSVVGFARRRVTGVVPSQDSFDAGRLDVTLVPSWNPITAATPFDAGFAYDPAMSRLNGDFSIGTNCAADRDLRAIVIVDRVPGGLIGFQNGLAVPGPWSVAIPGGCSGGNFQARASLIDDAGTTYGPQPVYAFSTARLPAHVPPLSVAEVPVSCARGARGTLTLALDPADCAAQRFTWTGAAITSVSDGGAQATFATATGDLQAQAGSELTVSITATIDPTNTDTQIRRVRLVPERFIEVTHRSDVPVAREEEAVGVEVTLTNPTACAVSGVTLREALGGLKVSAASVRVDGVEADAALVGDVLEVRGLQIPAGGTAKVRYLARVPLLSAARPLGTATFAGTDVTVLSGLPPPATGCGCNSSPPMLAWAALLLALVQRRRRSL